MPSSAILGQFTFNSFPCSSPALLWRWGALEGGGWVGGHQPLQTPLSNSPVSWLPARFDLWWETKGRKRRAKVIFLLLLSWAVSLAVAASSAFFCSCKTICLFLVPFASHDPNPWILEPGFPLLSFQPRSSRPFRLLLTVFCLACQLFHHLPKQTLRRPTLIL